MGAVCSGKRPQTSDAEDLDPPPKSNLKFSSGAIEPRAIEVDDMRSDFVQVENQITKTKKVVPLAGERKHKLPEKEPEETTNPALAVDADPTQIQVEVAQDLTMKRRNPGESVAKKTSTTAPIKFPPKKKAAPTPIPTFVDADSSLIQVEVSEDINLKKRTPMGSSPKNFSADLKADLEKSNKKRDPASRKRPPPAALNLPPEVTNIDTTDDDNLKIPSPRSDPPQSTRSDISEYDSVGEMFAAELQDEVPLSIDTGDLVQISEPEDALVTPMNSPEVPAQIVEEPVGKLADLFDDLGDDDNTDDFFGEEEEEVRSAAAPIEIQEEVHSAAAPIEPIQEEPKQDISEDEPAKEEPIKNEPIKEEPVKIEPKKEEPVKVETPEEPTVAPPPVQENIDEEEDSDVFEFDEPENATAKVETPLENSELIENAAAETKEDTGLHAAEESTNVDEDQSAYVALTEEPENADLANIADEPDDVENEKLEPVSVNVDLAEEELEHAIDPVLELNVSVDKVSDDFVDVQPKAALEDMAEPVVLQNPIDKVEELRDPSPDLKLFLVSEDGRASVRLNPADAESLQQYVKEDYSSGLANVEETDRERDIDPDSISNPRQYHEMYVDQRTGKWTAKRQNLAEQALAKEEELEDIRRQMRASRSLEKFESIDSLEVNSNRTMNRVESLEVAASRDQMNQQSSRSLSPQASTSPRRSRSKSPLIQRLSANFEKPKITDSWDQEKAI